MHETAIISHSLVDGMPFVDGSIVQPLSPSVKCFRGIMGVMGNNEHNALGNEILRLLDGRSQEWLARRAGVGQSTISRLIRGATSGAEPKTITRIAQALGVDSRHLLELSGLPVTAPARDPRIEHAAQLLEELPDWIRERAIQTVTDLVEQLRAIADAHHRLFSEAALPQAPPVVAISTDQEQESKDT